MKHVYFVNAHPDDLLTAIGVALQLKKSEKYVIHVIDVTHGERGLFGTVEPETCAAMRDAEERSVCAHLGVEPVWLLEHDGSAFASEESTRKLAEMYIQEPPDAIFTQWPLDLHLDHMVCATIALNAYRIASGLAAGMLTDAWPEVFFYHYAANSMADSPDCFIPLTEEEMQKKIEIISLYKCQNGPMMAETEKATNRFYGSKIGAEYAEAYTRFQPRLPGQTSLMDEI